jgi:PhnB protein
VGTWKPDGYHDITPRLVAHDGAILVDFLRRAFQATGDFHRDRPSEMRIGDSLVLVSGTGVRPSMPAFLYLYVEDTDATHARAVAAGARVLEEPRDLPYGDRRCMVEDPCGNVWQIATRLSPER